VKNGRLAARQSTLTAWSFAGLALLTSFGAAMVWRITQGADFLDESYYASFIYDWLKGGIRGSTLMTLHQTAELIVYPAAKVYATIVGGDTGLILFLRALFLIGNVAAGLTWLRFLGQAGFGPLRWLVAAAAVAFIPFGLPAPSYNTLGLQGLEIGLAAYGAAELMSGRAVWVWRSVSAAGWAVATVAYPTLAAVLMIFLAAILLARPRTGLASYLALVVGGQVLGWGLVLATLGWSRLHGSYVFLAEGNDVTGWSRKLLFTLGLLQRHPTFASECILAAALGLFGRRIGALAVSAAMIAMMALTLLLPPALFSSSHDLVLLLALSGLHLLAGFRPSAPPVDRLLAVLYLTAMAAGAVTTATAFNSLYNFAVGGGAAALLALLGPRSDWRLVEQSKTARAAVAAGAFLVLALTQFYGDRPGDQAPRQRVGAGVFAGLWVQSKQAETLKLVQDRIAPLTSKPGATIAEFGIVPGLILETGARPLMLAAFPIGQTAPGRPAVTFTTRFYQSRPADWVMIYREIHSEPYNPFGESFASRYRLLRRDTAALGSIELFERKTAG
jgi:hypothetical protein